MSYGCSIPGALLIVMGLHSLTVHADEFGIRIHQIESPFQRGETEVHVLLPDDIKPNEQLPTLFVLPVEAGRGTRWGDGVREVARADLHNTYRLIVVGPTFSDLPWYADHPSDLEVRQESYLVETVLPWLEEHYPLARHDRDGRLLLGFSKSGWGALSLLLRHPDKFARAAAWDAPLMLEAPGRYGSGPIFGTAENFSHYHLAARIESAGELLGSEPRLIHLGYGNFRTEHRRMEELLLQHDVPHVYQDGPQREHHWNSGWLADAVRLLVRDR